MTEPAANSSVPAAWRVLLADARPTDHQSANAWTTARPHIPGQILDQPGALALATRLFGHLLAG